MDIFKNPYVLLAMLTAMLAGGFIAFALVMGASEVAENRARACVVGGQLILDRVDAAGLDMPVPRHCFD